MVSSDLQWRMAHNGEEFSPKKHFQESPWCTSKGSVGNEITYDWDHRMGGEYEHRTGFMAHE